MKILKKIALAGVYLLILGDLSFAEEKGLVAYWSFDEGSGDIVKDNSSNGNNGKINGAKWVEGVRGYGLEFDGDYVDCGKDVFNRS
ncbi:MAG TPA: hypothetical protein P5150_06095 [Candidatus Ratteibacteria bacterium]|nr:hypothetical protein [Candidatus Ratteibacteria bacterium]